MAKKKLRTWTPCDRPPEYDDREVLVSNGSNFQVVTAHRYAWPWHLDASWAKGYWWTELPEPPLDVDSKERAKAE